MKTLAEMSSKEGIFFFVFLGDVIFNFSNAWIIFREESVRITKRGENQIYPN